MIQPRKKTAEITDTGIKTFREVQLTTLNILEDFNTEKLRLE